MTKHRITVARGDGIGPEIMQATLDILEAAGAPLECEFIEVGEALYKQGITSGVPDSAWDTLRRNECFLKGPITTPQGKGFKSVNVTIRKTLNLYANVRPVKSYYPFVADSHPTINLVIVRENEEDLYAGIEHRQTQEVAQVLKLITRPGTERIVRYAFEYARAYGRKKVTCMTKDNIMKLADGLFHQVFDEIAAEYPDIENDHMIIDIGAARLASRPEDFDVIVSLNLYGDILSDIAAEVGGSVGLAGSANIGSKTSMFEAVHGSAPDIAGQDLANPSGLLQGAAMMLVHLGEGEIAERIMNAWLCTLEDGVHTGDIYKEGSSKERVGCKAFAKAIIERLGQTPKQLEAVAFDGGGIKVDVKRCTPQRKELVGVDVFLDWDVSDRNPDVLGKILTDNAGPEFELRLITNRGVKVYPDGMSETFCTDHWRCRFRVVNDGVGENGQIIALLQRLQAAGVDAIKTENLYQFDGQPGYSLGQGE